MQGQAVDVGAHVCMCTRTGSVSQLQVALKLAAVHVLAEGNKPATVPPGSRNRAWLVVSKALTGAMPQSTRTPGRDSTTRSQPEGPGPSWQDGQRGSVCGKH